MADDDDTLLPEIGDAESAMKREDDDDSRSETGSESGSDEAEFECPVCDKRFSGHLPYKQHQRGKRHARAAARRRGETRLVERVGESEDAFCLPEAFAACKVCRKEFSGPENYRAHLRSKQHRQKVVEAYLLRQVREGHGIDADKLRAKLSETGFGRRSKDLQQQAATFDQDPQEEDIEFECDSCEKVFSGLTPYAQHLVSKAHARRLEGRRRLEEISGGGGTICLEEEDVLVCKACTVSFSGPESAALHLKSKKHAKQLDRYLRKLEKKKGKEAEKASKKPGDEEGDGDVRPPGPSVVKMMDALPSADEKAEETSKDEKDEASDKDVSKTVDTSMSKKMDALPSANKKAEKTSKESRDEKDEASDKDVPKTTDPSVPKMDALPSTNKKPKETSKDEKDEASDKNVPKTADSSMPKMDALLSVNKKAEETSKDEKDEASDKDVPKTADPSMFKKMDTLPSANKKAEETSKESRGEKASDGGVPKMSDPSMLKEMDRGATASFEDDIDQAFHRYQKYKEYKKLMNSLREDDSVV